MVETLQIRTETLGRGPALLIHNEGHDSLAELPADEVKTLFKKHGLLVFRGFGATPDGMFPFAQKFCSRFSKGGARKNYKGFVEEVDLGAGPIDLHSENANSPFRPDMIWFCCGRPADEDGETTYCDGIELLHGLSDSTRELFERKKIKFTRTYLPGVWKDYFGATTSVPVLRRMLDSLEGVSYRINEDESVYTEYVVPAINKTRWGGEDAFVNSLLTPWSGHKMMFEDGELLSDEVMDEIRQVSRDLTQDIPWQTGDLAMTDNTWILHGRRSFTDEQRQIFALLAWASF